MSANKRRVFNWWYLVAGPVILLLATALTISFVPIDADVREALNLVLTTLLSLTVSCIFAWIVAERFGDVAGAKLVEGFARQREKERLVRVLGAMRNAVDLATAITKHNAENAKPREAWNGANSVVENPRRFVQFRPGPFDIVFSGEIETSESLRSTIVEFLSQAEHVNALIQALNRLLPEAIPGSDRGSTPSAAMNAVTKHLEKIEEFCKGVDGKQRIPQILARLGELLRKEMECSSPPGSRAALGKPTTCSGG